MKIKRGTGIAKAFEITSVCKADILSLEKFSESKVRKLTEADMKKIASKLADDYCEQLFWNSLEIIVEEYLEDKQ